MDLVGKLLIAARNLIWNWRVAYKGDAFEHEREAYLCGLVYLDLATIAKRLIERGFVLNEAAQYEDKGQVLGGHRYEGNRQTHVRFFAAAKGCDLPLDKVTCFECRAHEEYNWQTNPVKHIMGVDVVDACPAVQQIFGDVML
jgi:hypothetical protein